ncbi:response regulator transcription factor [Aliiglaciecola sp. M165]|uniref:response regulator transcription factor n=1 Tax=Aliiglaciecola sp. M165 TaxID=2593649 RepID=UPI00117D4B8D|nr:response regulator transcription factor [Aliiglaciecola sp. M165]TRY30890.1 response regulator transcription factor [Aliiglaciecola sp. M165]
MKILLVEDNEETAAFIQHGFIKEGHEVMHTTRGDVGYEQAINGNYDILVFDRMLPELDGMTAVARIRKAGLDVPIIMLTAMSGINDRVEGLNAGADDYVVKPFAFEELYARVLAQLRRRQMDNASNVLRVGDLVLDRTTQDVTRGGQTIDLLPREYKILEYLMQHAGQIVTRKMLLEHVWGYKFDPKTSLVQTHVSRLRNRLDKPFEQDMITTHRGEGYVINALN